MKIENQHINKMYELLLSTLKMACPDLQIVSDDELKDNLEELEGDYYTFFYHDNLIPMVEKGLLNDTQVQNIELLRNLISNINSKSWNIDSFKTEDVWSEVRTMSKNILTNINERT